MICKYAFRSPCDVPGRELFVDSFRRFNQSTIYRTRLDFLYKLFNRVASRTFNPGINRMVILLYAVCTLVQLRPRAWNALRTHEPVMTSRALTFSMAHLSLSFALPFMEAREGFMIFLQLIDVVGSCFVHSEKIQTPPPYTTPARLTQLVMTSAPP
jgi:hypothetical protein